MPLRTDETPGVYVTSAAGLFALAARSESLTDLELRRRRDEILNSFLDAGVVPTPALMRELAEINLALGESE